MEQTTITANNEQKQSVNVASGNSGVVLALDTDAIYQALKIDAKEQAVFRTLALCCGQEQGAFIRESLYQYARAMLDNPECVPKALAAEMEKLLS